MKLQFAFHNLCFVPLFSTEHVIRVRLSGLMFPTSGDNLRITCNSTDASDTARPPPPPSPLPEKKLVKGGSVDNTPAPTEYRSAPSNTVTEAEIVPQPTPYNGCKDKIPDIEPGVYAHSPLCLSWMTDNLLNRKAMISLLDRQEISPAFLYQRKVGNQIWAMLMVINNPFCEVLVMVRSFFKKCG